MSEYSAALGHEPTERTRKALDRLRTMARNMMEENPDMSEKEAWEILHEAARKVIAKRYQLPESFP